MPTKLENFMGTVIRKWIGNAKKCSAHSPWDELTIEEDERSSMESNETVMGCRT